MEGGEALGGGVEVASEGRFVGAGEGFGFDGEEERDLKLHFAEVGAIEDAVEASRFEGGVEGGDVVGFRLSERLRGGGFGVLAKIGLE